MGHDPAKGLPPKGQHVTFADFCEGQMDDRDLRAQIAAARRRSRVERLEREAFSAAERARHATPRRRDDRDAVSIHSEEEPKWHEEHRARNRRERRQGHRASRIADDETLPLEERMRRQRIADFHRRCKTHWDYHAPRAPADGAEAPLRSLTQQQTRFPRIALASERNCRMVAAGFPVEVQKRFHAMAAWLDGEHEYRDVGGSVWSGRMMRKCVATWAAIAYGCRTSHRDEFSYCTTGLARKGIVALIGRVPETGRNFSLSALSDVDTGALAMLEHFELLVRTQLPGHVVPASDRDPTTGYAMNHYLFDHELIPGEDRWRESKGGINPSAPLELLEMTCPEDLALTDKQRAKLAQAHERKRLEEMGKSAARDAQMAHELATRSSEGPRADKRAERTAAHAPPLRTRPPPD